MSEFRGPKQEAYRASDDVTSRAMEAFGKPVPLYRKDAALKHCRAMGLDDTNSSMAMIDRMAQAIQRDEPYRAMEAGMTYLDLTGTYRLLAVLCVEPKPRVRVPYRRDQ